MSAIGFNRSPSHRIKVPAKAFCKTLRRSGKPARRFSVAAKYLNQNWRISDLFLLHRKIHTQYRIIKYQVEFSSEFPFMPFQVARGTTPPIRLWQCCDGGKTQDTTLNELADSPNCSRRRRTLPNTMQARGWLPEVGAGRGKRSRSTFLYTGLALQQQRAEDLLEHQDRIDQSVQLVGDKSASGKC